jgi:hypothetical protein
VSVLGWDAVPRFSEFIRRFTGQEEIVPPGLVVQADRPEWQFLQGVRLWTSGPITVAGAAGNRSKVEVPNLSASLMIVVTRAGILGALGAAGLYFLTMDGPAQGAPTQNFSRDPRSPGLLVQSVNRIGNAAGGVGGNLLDRLTADTVNRDYDFQHALPATITPGHNLQIWNDTLNQAVVAIFAGYEYNMRAEETVV